MQSSIMNNDQTDFIFIKFNKWVNQLQNPSTYYITLLNIIISNFTDVARKGTHKGLSCRKNQSKKDD